LDQCLKMGIDPLGEFKGTLAAFQLDPEFQAAMMRRPTTPLQRSVAPRGLIDPLVARVQ
jgi:hypothetical protein